MSDETNTNPDAQQQASSDGTQNTGDNGLPQSIPYDRFKAVNDAKKLAEDKLAKLEAAEKKRQDDEALKAGDYQKLIDGLKPKADRAEQLENTLKGYLEAEIEKIPQNMRDLIPAGDVTAQLAWIQQANAKRLFDRTPAPNTDAGATGDKKPANVKLTPEQEERRQQFGMTVEQYMKYLNQ